MLAMSIISFLSSRILSPFSGQWVLQYVVVMEGKGERWHGTQIAHLEAVYELGIGTMFL